MTAEAQLADPLDFDPEALRRKYREKRRDPVEFFQIPRDWRAEGQFRGLDIRRNSAS